MDIIEDWDMGTIRQCPKGCYRYTHRYDRGEVHLDRLRGEDANKRPHST